MPSTCSRRDALHYGLLLSIGGISTLTGCTSEPAGGDGRLEGEVVTTVPQEATVVEATDDRIAGEQLLQSFIKKTVRDGDATQELSEQEVEEVSDVLSELSRYEPTQQTDALHGYYIKQERTTVVVDLIINQ